MWSIALTTATLAVLLSPPTAAAPHDEGVLYIMPLWLRYKVASDAEFTAAAQQLKTRLPDGGPVRIGFTVYAEILMERWDVTTEAEAAANLGGSIAELDHIIARARQNNIPIVINFGTALRERKDAAQRVSQLEDRRVMQWFSDHSLADGWWTLSRYARRQYLVRQLYIKAMGRVIANRMARYPDTLIAASGDGEVELAFKANGPPYADYSPFAIAEFRDWLRGAGLYAPGQPFGADAYAESARYRGDASPAVDSNGDGHTLNGDFGTSFGTWDLRFFAWDLSDNLLNDPRAIPATEYEAAGWNSWPDAGANHFDPPRESFPAPQPWVDAWRQFREQMVSRYNRDFAEWITTTPDPSTGLVVPSSRWFTCQIPADYLYDHSPQNPDFRYLTSASSWRSADIRPFGGAGTTAFNSRIGNNAFARTLVNIAPLFASLNTRWAILEWNPSVPATSDPAIYRQEMAIVEQWRPSLVVPYEWYDDIGFEPAFEIALQEMTSRLRLAPWRLMATANGSQVQVSWQAPASGAAATSYVLEVGSTRGAANIARLETGSPGTILDAIGPPGTYYLRVRARRGSELSGPSNEFVLEVPNARPNSPSYLTAVTTGNTITFNWLAPAGGPRPTEYVLEAGSGPGLANLATMRLGAATTFVINNVPAGSYYVRVRAANALGTSTLASNDVIVTATGPGTHCTPVETPSPIAFRATGNRFTFEWEPHDRGAAPTSYRLDAGSLPRLADIASITLGSRSFAATVPSGTYYLQLTALGPCGPSPVGPVTRLVVP